MGKFFKLNSSSKELVCVQISKKGLSIALAKTKPVLQILDCQYFSGDIQAQKNNLSSFVAQSKLQHADCRIVLSREDYRLILIEKPKVADNELGESLHWLVKELIDFPLEEAVVDFFPAPMRTGQSAKIYVVVVRLQWLNTIADIVKAANLNLQAINIATLATRNLFSSLHLAENSAVFLTQEEEYYYILVVKDGLIYLERKLELSSQVVTELQNSIDFYQNRDKTIPIKIFLDQVLGQNKELIQSIEKTLNLQVEVLDISKLISLGDKANCLSVIGEPLESGTQQHINLVKFISKQQVIHLPFKQILQICALTLIIFLGYSLYNYKEQLTLDKHITKLQLQNNEAEKEMNSDRIRKKQELMKSDVIRTVLHAQRSKNSPGFSKYLEAIAAVCPNGVWLTSISINKQNNRTILSGKAYRPGNIVQLVSNLNNEPFFSSVPFTLAKIEKTETTYSFIVQTKEIAGSKT
ncbi:MAG: PilN domain-containing protein [bacterium]